MPRDHCLPDTQILAVSAPRICKKIDQLGFSRDRCRAGVAQPCPRASWRGLTFASDDGLLSRSANPRNQEK
jgi:hypothetical protein